MPRAWIRLDDEHAVLWSSAVDAPVSYVTRIGALDGDVAEQLQRDGHTWPDRGAATAEDLTAGNRAGPDETCLSVAALKRRYADADAYDSFTLEVADIAPYTCDDGGTVYWVPWAPGSAPDTLDGLQPSDLRRLGPVVA